MSFNEIPTGPYDGIIENLLVQTAHQGLLFGRTFVAKDMIDIEGYVTGCGNPDWLNTHEPAHQTATAVKRLLDAGATLVGKSCSDELGLSLDGINFHYGTPVNPQYTDRIPGGSSSGSASAVAAGLCDFAVGTDTAGSVRVPASYCGLFGFRPTHGRIPMDGTIPLGPSFDTIGWFAKTPELLRICGRVLFKLSPHQSLDEELPDAALLVTNCMEIAREEFRNAVAKPVREAKDVLKQVASVSLPEGLLADMNKAFTNIRGREVWQCHGQWLKEFRPRFGPGISERIYRCENISDEELTEAASIRQRAVEAINALIGENCVLVFPTTCDLPPLLTASDVELAQNRTRNLELCTIATVCGLPQLTIPVKSEIGMAGLSVVAGRGRDTQLLSLAEKLVAAHCLP